jgi:nucleoid DNA-binding protein
MTESLAQEEKEKYGRDFIIREIATRAGFTIGDARIMFNAFESIVEDIVAERSELLIGKLFSIYAKEIAPHEGHDLATGKPKMRNVGYRLTIKPSSTLKKLWKFGKTKTENPPEGEIK